MATMNISIPDTLKTWVDGKVKAGTYATASDYVRDLVRRDREHQSKIAELRGEIRRGLDGGIDPRPPEEIVEDVIARGRARHAKTAVRG